GHDRVIGIDGQMPWHLPADLVHFKSITQGHPVLMGRRTFESIGKPLPDRQNIVLSRADGTTLPAGCQRACSLDQAMSQAEGETVMVIGGGDLYRQVLPFASRLELTFVDADVEGDTRFPCWSRADWRPLAMRARPADDRNQYRLVFCSLIRASSIQRTNL
ncbi:MAG: dihydrofolate reductase, partial [Xanthomonadaceae bacterium]|nr:dihydrofolate reductase [Xanthomonadaceae bacterium]